MLVLQLLGSGCWGPRPFRTRQAPELSINISLPSVFKCPAFGVLSLCLLYISTIHPSIITGSPLSCLSLYLVTWVLTIAEAELLPLRLPFSSLGYQLSPPLINDTSIQGEIIKEKPSIGPKDATREGSIRDVL